MNKTPPVPILTCKTCIHSQAIDVRGAAVIGQTPTRVCRRFPPQLLLMPNGAAITMFPQVNDSLYCSEHETDAPKG